MVKAGLGVVGGSCRTIGSGGQSRTMKGNPWGTAGKMVILGSPVGTQGTVGSCSQSGPQVGFHTEHEKCSELAQLRRCRWDHGEPLLGVGVET